jgi:hypothetical protein
MKRILFILAAFLLLIIFNSCKKTDYPPSYKENCKVLSTTVSGMSNYNTVYTYDATGFISSEITNISGNTFEYKYTRKGNGEILSAQSLYNGEPNTTLKYTYSAGRVVELEEFFDDYPIGHVSNIKYNSKGLISEISSEYADYPEFSGKTFFEYNALGQTTKITNTDLEGNINNQEIDKNTGTATPASEVYLMEHGLPFQVIFSYAYSISVPGIGSTVEAYSADQNGKLVLESKLTMKTKRLNSRGYTESISYVDEKGKESTNVSYTFDCSNNGKMK